jgi:predicted amidohydrolase
VTRTVVVAAAQLGPIARNDSRSVVVERLVTLLQTAAERGAELVVFPELALTTFFPRWLLGDEELLSFFERDMPTPATKPVFDEARRLGVGFHLGYAELTPDGHRYNSAVLVERDGSIVARYRKIHLPGHEEHEASRPFQHLERRYFDPGPADGLQVHDAFGGRVGVAICNDRRWPETYRVLGLQGVELVLIGYNTPIHYPPDPSQDRLAAFHNTLVMAAGAYQNGTWVVGVAKGGVEEGVDGLCESQVIAPSGEIVAKCGTTGDEVVVAACDLDRCRDYKDTLFDFDRYRRPEAYSLITAVERGDVRL